MAYQLVLKRVNEEEKREKIALHIAEISGAQMQQVMNAISTKSISLGRDFSFEKAASMKQEFEALGAEILMKDLAAVAVTPSGAVSDDEDEEEGVLLTHAEYVKALSNRSDIFTVEKDKRLSFIMPFTIIMGLAWGFSLWSMNIIRVGEAFIQNPDKVIEIKLTGPIDKPIIKKKPDEVKKIDDEKVDIKKTSRRDKRKNREVSKGGGDPRQRVKKSGLFAIMSEKITNESIMNAEELALGGNAQGIDALLAGKKGIKKGSNSGPGRQGSGGIGFNYGSNSSFTGGVGNGVNLSNLTGTKDRNVAKVKIKDRKHPIRPGTASPRNIAGGRSRAEIMRTVRNNMASLKYAYNRQLKKNPDMGGKIKLKWAIDEFGNVMHITVVSSNLNNKEFEQEIMRKVKSWAFGKISIPGDVTEVVYPFVFTM